MDLSRDTCLTFKTIDNNYYNCARLYNYSVYVKYNVINIYLPHSRVLRKLDIYNIKHHYESRNCRREIQKDKRLKNKSSRF